MRIHTLAGLCAVLATLAAIPTQAATASTSKGQVSVAQLVEFLKNAETDGDKRQVLTAYLAGLGETVGIMIGSAGKFGASIRCDRAIQLDLAFVNEVVRQSAGDQSAWAEIPATPLLVSAIIERAGCK